MPLPGRPRNAGGNEVRFHRAGQSGVGDTRWRSGPRDRWHERAHVFVRQPGYTPGLQDVGRQDATVAHGSIRRLWRQTITYIPGPPELNWSENRVITHATAGPAAAQITRALRYKVSTVFRGAGSTNTRFGAPRPVIPPRHVQPRPTRTAGNLQGRPVLRNRLSSLGSRVPPVNRPSRAAEQPNPPQR